MANTIRLKRSAVASKVPTTGDLQLGELALNTYDGRLYTLKNDGSASVVRIGGTCDTSITFNNGGSGGSSGSTYNGGSALTVSYNTVGAPSTTGTNASGTWGISISGNSATTSGCTFANDATSKDDITTRTESGFYQSNTGTTAEGWPLNDGNWQHLIACTHSNDANYYSMQLAASFFSQNLYFRNTNGSGTTPWSTVVHSGNVSSYALPATGGTVSGDITMSGTGAIKVANGTTAQRPTPATGHLRYNTTLGCLEAYVQSAWQVIANTALDYGLITSGADTTFDYGALV